MPKGGFSKMGIVINKGAVTRPFVDSRTEAEKELDDWRFKMKEARTKGNWKAYRDFKKHYDKLCSRNRRKQ